MRLERRKALSAVTVVKEARRAVCSTGYRSVMVSWGATFPFPFDYLAKMRTANQQKWTRAEGDWQGLGRGEVGEKKAFSFSVAFAHHRVGTLVSLAKG